MDTVQVRYVRDRVAEAVALLLIGFVFGMITWGFGGM